MQAKWGEIFGEREEDIVEEVKVKRPRQRAIAKKAASKQEVVW